MKNSFKEFLGFAGRAALIQTVTYFVFGLIMSNLFDYGSIFQQDVIRDFMRPIDSPPHSWALSFNPSAGCSSPSGCGPSATPSWKANVGGSSCGEFSSCLASWAHPRRPPLRWKA